MKIILLNKLDPENMREATKEEQDSVNDYVNSISTDIGPTPLAQTEKSTDTDEYSKKSKHWIVHLNEE